MSAKTERANHKANVSTPEMQTFDDEETYSETYPEGGKEAWLVVAGAWCAMIPSMGVLNTLAVLQAWVSEHELEGMSESTIGWVFSTYAFFLYFCGAQVGVLSHFPKSHGLNESLICCLCPGPIFDAHDIRLLVVPGCIGIVASTMILSVCKGEHISRELKLVSYWSEGRS